MIRFARPEALLLALPILLLLRGRLAGRGLVAWLRALLLAALLGALAEPWLPGAESGRDLIFVVDRSHSVADEHGPTINETLAAAADAGASGDRTGVVLFGRNAVVDAPPRGGFRPAPFAKDVDRDGSDLAQAIDAALALVPPGRQASLAILSDGESTGRPPEDVAREAARRGIRIDVVPLRRPAVADVRVEEISLPGEVGEREPFQWSAWVRSDREIEAPVRLIRDGVLQSESLRLLKPGLNRLVFRDRLSTAGVRRYEIEVGAEGDRIAENNRALGVVRVEGASRILVVSPGGREDRLSNTLRAAGLDVTVAAPDAAPFRPEQLDDFRSVVLQNVPAARLPRGAQRALRSYVEDFGGGLWMTGGKASFGLGGYRRGDVETVLPVTLEVRQEQRKFALAMSVALDRSGSMGASAGPGLRKMDLANQGTIEAVRRLGPNDSISVLAVDSSPHVVVSQRAVDDLDLIVARVKRIESSGGGIFVGEALHAAADQLASAPQRNKHLILFADAADAEEPTDYKTFVPQLVAAGVTVSAIGLGVESDVDAALLKEIAVLGQGRCFFASDPADLPRVFAEETMQVARAAFIEEPAGGSFTSEMASLGDVAGGAFPTLDGYSIAYLRPGASAGVVSTDEQRAPLFAFRQAGLGRTAAFLGEIDGHYSKGFAAWDGAGGFMTTVARWLGGSEADGGVFTDFVREGHEAVLTAEVEPGQEGRLGSVTARVAGPDGEARDVVMTRVGERRLEARVPMTGEGIWRAVVDGGDGKALRTPPLALPYSPEYAAPADPNAGERLLAELAAATGGKVSPSAADLRAGPRESAGFQDLVAWFLTAAVLLLLFEIAVRRLDLRVPKGLATRLVGMLPKRAPRAPSTRAAKPKAASATVETPSDAEPAAAPPATSLADALARAKKRSQR